MALVLVTGASSGIGAATARAAAQAGYDVAITYRTDRTGAETVAEAVGDAGQRPFVIQADVTDAAAVAEMFAEIDRTKLPLTGLVNNAGIVPARN
ncbi:MAG: SDR family NAD(P)-dependent oxidoreductase, partial [Pseudomonadota bacterium]